MPETTKKPIKIVPNTIKTIPKIKPATIIPKKTLEEQLEEIYDDIDVNVDDLPDELLEVYEELEGDYKEKSIQKNWKLWLSMFTPFILPAFIKGVSGQVTLPYDARQSVQSNAPEPKVVVDYAKKYFEEHGLELVKTLSKTDCERLKVQLKDNWGKGPDAFKKSFQEDYANTKARLDSIYRTEYVTAQNEGILARSRDAGHKMKQWNAALDERTCPVCGDQLHGTIIPIEEQFSAVVEHKNGSEEISVNGPPAHPNCFVPDTKCIVPGEVLGAARSWYDGSVFKINFESGTSITVTPNHMILTDRGFAAAHLLNNGDNVLYCPNFERMPSSINRNNDNSIPTIEQIFSSLLMTSNTTTRSMPSSSIDFHGDGEFIKGNIDIIDTNRFLLGNTKSSFLDPVFEDNFCSRNIRESTFNTFRSLAQIFEGSFTTTNSIMGIRRESDPFFLCRFRHSQEHCFATGSSSNSMLSEGSPDKTGITTQFFGNGLNRHIGLEKTNNLIGINSNASSVRNTQLIESSSQSSPTTTENISNFLTRHSGFIVRNKIISINVLPYHGYVYDIQSINSLLICNGVIASNCRCVLTTLNEEDYDEIKEDSAYLGDVFETIKLNYKCKAGTVDDSNACVLNSDTNTSSNKPKNDIVSLKEEQKAIKRILLDYNRLSQPKDDSYNQLSNRLKEINKTLDIETPKSVSVDITAPSRSALEKMIQGDPKYDDDPLPWDEDYNVKLGGTLYQIRLEGWYDDCLESRGYDKIDPDKYQDVIQSDFKQIVSDESGWGNSKENIYGYVPNVPGTTYGVTYIGRPIKTKQNSDYLNDVTEFIKLNYKCPKGTIDDSNKCVEESKTENNKHDKPKIDNLPSLKKYPTKSENTKNYNNAVKYTEDIITKMPELDKAIKSYITSSTFMTHELILRPDIERKPLDTEKAYQEFSTSNNLQETRWHGPTHDKIARLDEAMKHFKLPTDMVLYSGISKDFYDAIPKSVGDEFKSITFISTSSDESIAKSFAKERKKRDSDKPKFAAYLEIFAPVGSTGIATEESAKRANPEQNWVIGKAGSQKEVVLNRQQKYKVIGIESDGIFKKIKLEMV